jgi:hypothetical protein
MWSNAIAERWIDLGGLIHEYAQAAQDDMNFRHPHQLRGQLARELTSNNTGSPE